MPSLHFFASPALQSEKDGMPSLRHAEYLLAMLKVPHPAKTDRAYWSEALQETAEALVVIPPDRLTRIWGSYQRALMAPGVVRQAILAAAGYTAKDWLRWRRDQATSAVGMLKELEAVTGFEASAGPLLVEVSGGDARLVALALACAVRRDELADWVTGRPDVEALAVVASLRGYPNI